MTAGPLIERVAAYYEGKLRDHGATPAGVDWNSEASQQLRFQQLLRIVMPQERPGTLNDFGCGYGALADYLATHHAEWRYCGFDVSPKMIEAAGALHPPHARRVFTSDIATVPKATYTVASGIFNVKLDVAVSDWHDYVLTTLDTLASLSEAGFAFNVLTGYADPARQRPDLFYADPLALFEHCRRRFSVRVALLHDYPLFEFTMLVRL
jgi:SAM-dependent methyltransferase